MSAVSLPRLDSPRTCIIGAGSSGIVAVKALVETGVSFDCFEESDRIGGLWVFGNANGRSAAYRSLSINTSRARMEYADFPMPADYPDYPGHAQIAAYFEAYAARFDLARHIRFRTRVEHAAPRAGGGFDVTLSDGTSAHYDALIVANGHHWDPKLPEPPPGTFDGISMHSSQYVSPTEPHALAGRRVVVVGLGNSAVDIASELARASNTGEIWLSVRRGAWVLPKYVFGRPLDQLGVTPGFLPLRARQAIARWLYRAVLGRVEAHGLPAPDHQIGNAHPTVSSELLPLLKAGRIHVKPPIASFHGTHVAFTDGSREAVDAIVYATGYNVSFPFFDPSFVSAPENELPLYFRTLHPDIPGLFFIGLAQPLGAIMPIAEAQAKLVADAIAGRYVPPASSEMRRSADAEREAVRRRYVASRRHTMQVDFDEFMAALRQEHTRGRARVKS
jgi:dimethylaniline monooxygenase (N-oxide forming)